MPSDAALTRPAPLENLTLWQRVYDHLRAEILAGGLQPGAELAEVALSEQLGVSRGPIREAIGRLASEGLVTVRPRRGAVVRSLSKEEFVELYQVREALELMAVKLAVPRLRPEDIAALQGLINEMAAHAEHGEVGDFFEANAAFHVRLFEAAGTGSSRSCTGNCSGSSGGTGPGRCCCAGTSSAPWPSTLRSFARRGAETPTVLRT